MFLSRSNFFRDRVLQCILFNTRLDCSFLGYFVPSESQVYAISLNTGIIFYFFCESSRAASVTRSINCPVFSVVGASTFRTEYYSSFHCENWVFWSNIVHTHFIFFPIYSNLNTQMLNVNKVLNKMRCEMTFLCKISAQISQQSYHKSHLYKLYEFFLLNTSDSLMILRD